MIIIELDFTKEGKFKEIIGKILWNTTDLILTYNDYKTQEASRMKKENLIVVFNNIKDYMEQLDVSDPSAFTINNKSPDLDESVANTLHELIKELSTLTNIEELTKMTNAYLSEWEDAFNKFIKPFSENTVYWLIRNELRFIFMGHPDTDKYLSAYNSLRNNSKVFPKQFSRGGLV